MSEPMNILVVEDDESLRDALLVTLEAAGHRATGADGGPAALALIAREAFSMVVSDLRMAPMDGLELLAEIRTRKPGLPVLLMTAFGDVDKAVAAVVDELKKRIADLGLGISGTGVRNNFTTADKEVRAQGVKHIKEFVEVAARLGAPVIRVFADTQMRAQNWHTVSNNATRQQVQDWISAALRECADHGRKYGVKIGVQNHGDFIATAKEHLALVKAVDSPFCGPIVDTGYFKTPDPYVDIAEVAPHAINWQVKQSVFGEDSEIPTEMNKLLTIIRKSGYSGYLPIETLSPQGKPYDPFKVVPDFLAKLKEAIAATA